MTYAPANSRYDNMQYRRCGRSGLLLPAISLGLWHNFGGVDSLENCRSMLHRAFDLGITHFDLANNYGPPPGSAEENFGRILHTDFAAHRVVPAGAGIADEPLPEWHTERFTGRQTQHFSKERRRQRRAADAGARAECTGGITRAVRGATGAGVGVARCAH